jgi:hypothetical protein
MSKICPNCLRTVRNGANYCGFCGTSLVPASVVGSGATRLALQDEAVREVKPTYQERSKPKRFKSERARKFFPIILLFLVIIVALVVRFWPDIIAYLMVILTSLRL